MSEETATPIVGKGPTTNDKENDKKKRRSLSIPEKIKILDEIDNGVPVDVVASDRQLHPGHVRNITDIITDAMLQAQALELRDDGLAPQAFKASNGWVRNFKKRYQIKTLSVQGEKAAADEPRATEYIGELMEFIETEKYALDDIYNMDETGCCWKSLPKKTLAHAGEKRVDGGKVKKDRFTAVMCANSTGTHRMRLMIIGKAKTPRCFKAGYTPPVIYTSQDNAWMTIDIFKE
ncbi:Jerky protein homolog-like [Frankliniella fusca]|uniref:Jerky protein homolog-like n=1 Tax=Frankliniella fusca TaxID=407009 RepID=A0AAE1HT39_9NEOP|nr:Jerky protein homolog-like [Frankliniella fusca]